MFDIWHWWSHKYGSLESMIFSMLSMLLNSEVFRKTVAAKQTNIIMSPELTEIQFTYSMNSLATWKMVTSCAAMLHPNNKKPKTSFFFDESNLLVCVGALLMPRSAYCFRTVRKISIFCSRKFIFEFQDLFNAWRNEY